MLPRTGRPGPDSARGPETAGKPRGRPGSGTSRTGRQGTAPPGPSRAAVGAAAGLRVWEHGGRRGHAPPAPGEPRGSRPGKSGPLHCPRRLRGPSGGVLAASRVRAPGPDSSRCPSPTLPAAAGLAQGSHTPGRRPVLKMNPLDGTAAPEMRPLWSARPLPPPFVDQKRPAQAPEASSPAFPVGVGSPGLRGPAEQSSGGSLPLPLPLLLPAGQAPCRAGAGTRQPAWKDTRSGKHALGVGEGGFPARISLGVEVHSCQELGPCDLCPLADGWPRSSTRGRTPAQPGHRFCFEAGGGTGICTCPLLLASGPVSCPSSEALRGSGAGPRGSRPLWRHSGRRRRQRGGVVAGWMAGGAPGAKPPPNATRPGDRGWGRVNCPCSHPGLSGPSARLECPGLLWAGGGRRRGWGPRDGRRESPATASARAADFGDGRLLSSPPSAELTFGVCLCPTPAARPPFAQFADRPAVRSFMRARAFPCRRLGRAPMQKIVWPRQSRRHLPWHHDCSLGVPPTLRDLSVPYSSTLSTLAPAAGPQTDPFC